ncbi:MAG: hypothetical protein EBT86_01225 [Actinobacteria bacterium]|nr:hypothetical protein [Actinomycetota bacterium]NDG26734.1 hypothetical protein [Pseudomonadota bacterium]
MPNFKLNWDTVCAEKDVIEVKHFPLNPSFLLTKLSNKSQDVGERLAWYRSVVWEKSEHSEMEYYTPVCVAPPRAWEVANEFTDISNGMIEDFVEGTMVNVFVTAAHTVPQITTRSSLGATGTFYSERTFRDLFMDALEAKGKTLSADVFSLGAGEKARFWSFVLAHPQNRIVEDVKSANLTLVHEGWVDSEKNITVIQRPSSFWQLPVKYESEKTVDSVTSLMNTLGSTYGPTWQGLVVRMPDGNRLKFVQTAYTRLRNWRQEPNRDVRLLWLVRENSKVVAEYIKYFPEDLERFLELNKILGRIYRELYGEYQAVHIKHNKKLEAAIDFYRPHVFSLHGLYINTLKPKKWFVRMKEVRDYIGNMPWQRLNYIIRRIEGKVSAPVATVVTESELSVVQG